MRLHAPDRESGTCPGAARVRKGLRFWDGDTPEGSQIGAVLACQALACGVYPLEGGVTPSAMGAKPQDNAVPRDHPRQIGSTNARDTP